LVRVLAPASVVVACHTEDRWQQLLRAIDSAKEQEPPPAEIIVVVDHNPALLERLKIAEPSITTVANGFERGASGARNTGALLATMPTVAFLDDDATAEPTWLRSLIAPLSDPAVLGSGGAVVPRWLGRRPAWFPDEFGWVVGVSFTGMPTQVGPIRNVWGENMAVDRVAFDRVGGFRNGFGKIGDRSRPEDTDLCIRMRQAAPPGSSFVFVPDAVVRHDVPVARSTLRFFLRRCFNEGFGKVEMSRQLGTRGNLGTEHDWLRSAVPEGVRRELRSLVHDRRVAPAGRIAGIVIGIVAAGAGAAAATLRPGVGRGKRGDRQAGATGDRRRGPFHFSRP